LGFLNLCSKYILKDKFLQAVILVESVVYALL